MATTLKIKKKRWVGIYAPKMFGEIPLGETFVGDATEAQGKYITVSMMQLSHDPKKQNVNVTFVVEGQKEGGVGTKFIGMNIVPSALKRLVRRNKEKIDDSFSVVTNDGQLVRLKPLLVTRGHVTAGTLRDIRVRMRNVVAWEVSKCSYDKLCGDLIDHKVQRAMQEACAAIYPLSVCEIRQFRLLGPAKSTTGPGILVPPTQPPFVPKPKKQAQEGVEDAEPQAQEAKPEAKPEEAPAAEPAQETEEKPKKKAKKKKDEE